ncbi:MAG: hypothetical protein HYT79_07350 [Elusimicrobia bacterium]|nr:hypothetical protein [Elusimicrobiota bacterium]
MAKNKLVQYSVPLSNEPGALSKLTKTLAAEKINVTSFMSESLSDVAYFRFLAEESNNVKRLLEKSGYQAFETPAVDVELSNKPGELNRLAKALGEKGVNILNIYATANPGEYSGRVVLIVDQPEKAQPLLAKFSLNGGREVLTA